VKSNDDLIGKAHVAPYEKFQWIQKTLENLKSQMKESN